MLTASLETLKSVSVVVRTYMCTCILYTYMFVNTVYLQCLLYSTNLHTYSVYTTYVIRTCILCAYYTIHMYVHARAHCYGYTYKHMYMYVHTCVQ